MNTIITEARVTLDPGFFGQDVVVLAFKISENLLEAKEGIYDEGYLWLDCAKHHPTIPSTVVLRRLVLIEHTLRSLGARANTKKGNQDGEP